MMLVLLSNNLGFLWIGTEATTLATAFLVAFYERESSIEAAWKYVIICSVGIALALFGIILTYFSALHVVPAVRQRAELVVADVVGEGAGPRRPQAGLHLRPRGVRDEGRACADAHVETGCVQRGAGSDQRADGCGARQRRALLRSCDFTSSSSTPLGGSFAPTLFIIFGLVSMGVPFPFILAPEGFQAAARLFQRRACRDHRLRAGARHARSRYFGALLHLLNNAMAKTLLFLTGGQYPDGIQLEDHAEGHRSDQGHPGLGNVSHRWGVCHHGMAAVRGVRQRVHHCERRIRERQYRCRRLLFLGFVATMFVGFIYYTSTGWFSESHVQRRSRAGAGRRRARERQASLSLVLGVLAAALLVLGVVLPAALQQQHPERRRGTGGARMNGKTDTRSS